MDELTLTDLCHLYALGEPMAPLEPVTGGLLHRVYRLQTASGRFAVKVLNPTVMQYPNVRENFRRSERIASAVAAASLPAVPALQCEGEVIHDLGQVTVLVFPWVEGRALTSAAASPAQAQQIGSLLGRIHVLPLHVEGLPLPVLHRPSEDEEADWALLVEEAEREQFTWAGEVRGLLPQIAVWLRSAEESRQALGNKWVLSHGDLDQKNVLWSDESTPSLIDWEAAGYVQPAIEAVCGALDWGGQAAGALDVAVFRAYLAGYRREALLTDQEVGHGLYAYCGNWCGWLKFNMLRSLGRATEDPEEQALGTRETLGTLALLRSAAINIPRLARES